MSYMTDGTSEGQRNKVIEKLLAKVVDNVWLREAQVDDTLYSYWHSSRPSGQAGFTLWPREQDSFIMLTHLHQRFWTATVSARRKGLSASTIHNRLRKKNYLVSADRPQKVRQWRDVTGLPMCNGLNAISSGSVSTGTGFRSVAKPDLHSAMLVVKRTNKHCWDCYVLERDRFGGGSFVVWSWKNGWPEDVLCCHARQFQCIISTTSCDHFSIIYTHKKLK